MKRYIKIFTFALCSLFAVSACSVVELDNPGSEDAPTQEVVPTPEIPYEIRLMPPTKTANDGLSTIWVDGDKVNVFHAEAGKTDYINDGAFVFSNEDRFSGTIKSELEEGKSYDWYVCYPYDPSMTTPKYMRVTIPTIQTQLADGDMSHLCEKMCPLAGKVLDVPAAENPNVWMSHLVTVMKIKVTNYESTPCNLQTVSFAHHTNENVFTTLAGVHYVDMTGKSMEYTLAKELDADNITLPGWEDNSDLTKTSLLAGDPTRPYIKLTNPKMLGLNESATVYVVCKPFTIGNATLLSVGMNNINGGVSQAIYGKNPVCKAGSINGIKQGSRKAPPFKSGINFYHGKKNADGTYSFQDTWWRCELPKGFDLQGEFNFKDLFTTTNSDARFTLLESVNQNATVQGMYDAFAACLNPDTGQWTGNSSLEVNLNFPDTDRSGIFVNSSAGYNVGSWAIMYYEAQ